MKSHKYLLLIVLLFSIGSESFAQGSSHSKNILIRETIDAKSAFEDPTGKEGLLRAHEYISMDSTYYVGYMFEGLYLSYHAADYFGFNNAVRPLVKALNLLEADYDSKLKVRTSDYFKLYYAYKFQLDYQTICDMLLECYNNTEQTEAAYKLIRNALKYHLQTEYFFNPYIALSWLTHRNRTLTSKDHPFLKNSVDENVLLAQKFLDSAVERSVENKSLNTNTFVSVYEENLLSVAHYREILYTYTFDFENAEKFQKLLLEAGRISSNNYGNYLSIIGRFEEAQTYYERASRVYENRRGSLREYVYFTSTLELMKGSLHSAQAGLEAVIKNLGSTPGFGWYNIALARVEVYNGDFTQSIKHIDKAANFKELHINTTFGQRQYDFSLNVVKYLYYKRSKDWYKKRFKDWWWNPTRWGTLWRLMWQAYTVKYQLVRQMNNNPERFQVIYPVFASENTSFWDEYLILFPEIQKRFFLDYFKNQAVLSGQRPDIIPYYKLFIAKMYFEKKEYSQAKSVLIDIIESENIDREYGRLLIARCYEMIALIEKKIGSKKAADDYFQAMYINYPQLAAFSKYKQKLVLDYSGIENKELKKGLHKMQIDWVTDKVAPVVNLNYAFEDKKHRVVISIHAQNGLEIVSEQTIISDDEDALLEQVQRALFGMYKN